MPRSGLAFILLAVTSALAGAQLAAAQDPTPRSDFQDRVAAMEREAGGRLGVAAIDTGSGLVLGYRDTERFAMCSTFKLILAAAVLSRVDSGLRSLADPVQFGSGDLVPYSPVTAPRSGDGWMTVAELCEAAMTVSDNTAANLLLELVDGPQGLTEFARSLGDPETRLDRWEPDLNENLPGDPRDTTTPAAMVAIMRMLLAGDALRPASRGLLLSWLVGSETGHGRIRAGVDRSWEVGNKSGSGGRGATNDIAVITPAGRAPILIAVYYSESTGRGPERERVIAEAARLVIAAVLE